jgi:hypothetical protein
MCQCHYILPENTQLIKKNPDCKILRLPVTMDLPPVVVNNEAVSLRALDLATVTTWTNLPKACQNLYHNIAGKNVSLDAESSELAQAIHKSVVTPGYWAYNKLESKCKDPEHNNYMYQYLRITIGSNKVRPCVFRLSLVCSSTR